MTLQRTGSGTGGYVPPRVGATPDVYGLANPANTNIDARQPQPPKFEWVKLDQGDSVVGWRITYYDLTDGLNMTRGNLLEAHSRTAKGTLDTRYPQTAVLPRLTTVQASPDPPNIVLGQMMGARVFGSLAIAILSGASDGDVCLLKETSTSDPTLVDTTYTPGAGNYIGGIWPLSLGGSATPRLVVGRLNAAAQVLSDLGVSPTIAGTMHSKTANAYAMIQTALPNAPILMICGTSMYSLDSTVAFTSDPGTATLTNIPAQAQAVGLASLSGGPLRAYWVWRKDGAFSSNYGAVISTNQEGTDPQELTMPLRTVYSALKVRDGIVAGDGSRLVHHNGQRVQDLGIMRDRDRDSDYIIVPCSAGIVENEDLYALIYRSSSAGTECWVEQYQWDKGSYLQAVNHGGWLPVTARQTLDAGDPPSNFYAFQGLPYSDATSFMHYRLDGSWRRFPTVRPGQNPFYRRQTTGGSDSNSDSFESTGYWVGPESIFPSPIEYAPKVIDRIFFGGDVDAGGTGATVQVTAGGVSHTFKQPLNNASRVREFTRNDAVFLNLTPRIDATRGSDANFTPQCLPITIEGRAFLKGLPKGDWRGWQ